MRSVHRNRKNLSKGDLNHHNPFSTSTWLARNTWSTQIVFLAGPKSPVYGPPWMHQLLKTTSADTSARLASQKKFCPTEAHRINPTISTPSWRTGEYTIDFHQHTCQRATKGPKLLWKPWNASFHRTSNKIPGYRSSHKSPSTPQEHTRTRYGSISRWVTLWSNIADHLPHPISFWREWSDLADAREKTHVCRFELWTYSKMLYVMLTFQKSEKSLFISHSNINARKDLKFGQVTSWDDVVTISWKFQVQVFRLQRRE